MNDSIFMADRRTALLFLLVPLLVVGLTSPQGIGSNNDAQAKVEYTNIECGENECCGSPAPSLGCPMPPAGYRLRVPGIPSGASCRGACGVDCTPVSCTTDVPNYVLCVSNGASHRNCHYPVTECGSHICCRRHDQCYDNCAAFLPPDEVENCKRGCDNQCLVDPDCAPQLLNCPLWAIGEGPQPDRLRYVSSPVVGGLFPGPCP